MLAIFGVALATGFSGAVVPGSLLAVVVTESVRYGWAAGPYLMIGHGALELAAMILLITGVITFARAPKAQATIGLVGAAVLVYLGYQTLSIPGEAGMKALQASASASEGTGGWLRLAWLGALMSAANPYWWLWWATIGTAHTGWAVREGRLGGGVYWVGHVLSDVIWYCAVAAALGAGRAFFSAGVLRGIYLVCGTFLLALAAVFGIAAARTLRRAKSAGSRCEAEAGLALTRGSQEEAPDGRMQSS
jgi:threonine/homoserine/homoserine lactone efflux protein